MTNTTIQRCLRLIILGMGLLGLILYLWAIPEIGNTICDSLPEFSYCYYPWLIFLWITGIPCYGVLILAWKISGNVGNNAVFTQKTAMLFSQISWLSIIDTAIFFLGNLIYFFLEMNHPGILAAAVLITFIGIAFSFCMKVVSEYVGDAARLQEENELTI